MPVNIQIPELGDKFKDYRDDIPGDSYSWGPVIKANEIQYFTFHHTVTKQTAKLDGNWKAECDKIANLHISPPNAWGGVGYRFIICSDGTVAYVGDLSHGGSAVANKNDIMFSAAFVGDFTKELPTAAQVHSAHLLAKFFLTQAPQYPKLDSWDDIKGHREFNPTACPGSAWKTEGDNLYTRIRDDKWQGYPDPQPTTTPAPPSDPIPPVDPCEQLKKDLADANQKIDDLTVEKKIIQGELNEYIAHLAAIKTVVNK